MAKTRTKAKSKDDAGPFMAQCPPPERGGCGSLQPMTHLYARCQNPDCPTNQTAAAESSQAKK